MKVIILGAGLVGGPMAVDLAKDKNNFICSVDNNVNALNRLKNFPIKTVKSNLKLKSNVKKLIRDFDFVVNALPGFMGFSTLKTIIESKKDVVDISFFPEEPFELDDLAKKNRVTAVVDAGVAPGLSNLIVGNLDKYFDSLEKILIYVGGLPKVRIWPYEYKAVFSPADVIEEYTRPARYLENGKEIIKPALSENELIHFGNLGTLEAFNSDGLRTLSKTINCPNMKEKTLRYPGHIEKMAMLRESGFFDKNKIEINGVEISPLEFTSKILFPNWKFDENDRDITVMKIIVEGLKNSEKIHYEYDLFDEYDEKNQTHSMARTTGFTGTSILRMLNKRLFNTKGIIPPEIIGREKKCISFILGDLKKRGIELREIVA